MGGWFRGSTRRSKRERLEGTKQDHRFTAGIETLIPVITSDVEQFITAQSQAAAPAHLALTSDQPLLIEHIRGL